VSRSRWWDGRSRLVWVDRAVGGVDTGGVGGRVKGGGERRGGTGAARSGATESDKFDRIDFFTVS
jgi:hypothetical protein